MDVITTIAITVPLVLILFSILSFKVRDLNDKVKELTRFSEAHAMELRGLYMPLSGFAIPVRDVVQALAAKYVLRAEYKYATPQRFDITIRNTL